jgi:hypothetical protein
MLTFFQGTLQGFAIGEPVEYAIIGDELYKDGLDKKGSTVSGGEVAAVIALSVSRTDASRDSKGFIPSDIWRILLTGQYAIHALTRVKKGDLVSAIGKIEIRKDHSSRPTPFLFAHKVSFITHFEEVRIERRKATKEEKETLPWLDIS